MQTYEMICTCGQAMKVEAQNSEEAVAKMKEKMDKKAIKSHWDDMHVGNPRPSVRDVHIMIEQQLMPAPSTA